MERWSENKNKHIRDTFIIMFNITQFSCYSINVAWIKIEFKKIKHNKDGTPRIKNVEWKTPRKIISAQTKYEKNQILIEMELNWKQTRFILNEN